MSSTFIFLCLFFFSLQIICLLFLLLGLFLVIEMTSFTFNISRNIHQHFLTLIYLSSAPMHSLDIKIVVLLFYTILTPFYTFLIFISFINICICHVQLFLLLVLTLTALLLCLMWLKNNSGQKWNNNFNHEFYSAH